MKQNLSVFSQLEVTYVSTAYAHLVLESLVNGRQPPDANAAILIADNAKVSLT